MSLAGVTTRKMVVAGILIAGTVVLGGTSIAFRGMPGADLAGGALYTAVFAFAGWLLWRPVVACIAAFVWSSAVELLQLTSLPAQLSEQSPVFRLLLGRQFMATDFVSYLLGAVVAYLVLRFVADRQPEKLF